MNEHTMKGTVNELKAKAKKFWAKLTDDDFKDFDGNVDSLKGKVQKTYGYGKEELEEQFSRFNDHSSSSDSNEFRSDSISGTDSPKDRNLQ